MISRWSDEKRRERQKLLAACLRDIPHADAFCFGSCTKVQLLLPMAFVSLHRAGAPFSPFRLICRCWQAVWKLSDRSTDGGHQLCKSSLFFDSKSQHGYKPFPTTASVPHYCLFTFSVYFLLYRLSLHVGIVYFAYSYLVLTCVYTRTDVGNGVGTHLLSLPLIAPFSLPCYLSPLHLLFCWLLPPKTALLLVATRYRAAQIFGTVPRRAIARYCAVVASLPVSSQSNQPKRTRETGDSDDR